MLKDEEELYAGDYEELYAEDHEDFNWFNTMYLLWLLHFDLSTFLFYNSINSIGGHY